MLRKSESELLRHVKAESIKTTILEQKLVKLDKTAETSCNTILSQLDEIKRMERAHKKLKSQLKKLNHDLKSAASLF